MRNLDRWILASTMAILSGCLSARAQSQPSLPGCEQPKELATELRQALDPKVFQGMKFAEQWTLQVEILNKLIEKYPREVAPTRELMDFTYYSDPSVLPAVQERFKKRVTQNPDDPLALYLAGYSLIRTDTPEAIRELDRAKTIAPTFPWPYFTLARVYATGKTADKNAMTGSLMGFFNICPSSINWEAQRLLSKMGNDVLMKKATIALRVRLKTETDPLRLMEYGSLWRLEFQTHPPQEYDAIRKRVAEDLKRMESLKLKPDAEFEAFLLGGYEQSGASPETIKSREDQILKEYPQSSEAYEVVSRRWRKLHKEPEDQKDTAAWVKYDHEWKEALKGWIREFPGDYDLAHYAWTYTIENEEALPDKEWFAVFETRLKEVEESGYPQAWQFMLMAQNLLKYKVHPELSLDLLYKAKTLLAKERENVARDTNRTPDEITKSEDNAKQEWGDIVSATLEAARQLKKPELVETMRAEIEAPPPHETKRLSWYWSNRARLAVVDGRNPDALAYYQLAIQLRPDTPQPRHGKIDDDLGDEIKSFWKELRGTDTAWEVWKKPPANGKESTEGRWEKPTKTIPNFELVDLSGKTWRLTELKGKAVFINVWATWCGPCREELPNVEKLYEMLKDRSDIQVLTFSSDYNPGLIQPFMEEHGYKFPVLPAYSFVNGLLDSVPIPQNWIVDPQGTWVWTQIGFKPNGNWENSILQALETAKIRK